jgi:hypothetical protein
LIFFDLAIPYPSADRFAAHKMSRQVIVRDSLFNPCCCGWRRTKHVLRGRRPWHPLQLSAKFIVRPDGSGLSATAMLPASTVRRWRWRRSSSDGSQTPDCYVDYDAVDLNILATPSARPLSLLNRAPNSSRELVGDKLPNRKKTSAGFSPPPLRPGYDALPRYLSAHEAHRPRRSPSGASGRASWFDRVVARQRRAFLGRLIVEPRHRRADSKTQLDYGRASSR